VIPVSGTQPQGKENIRGRPAEAETPEAGTKRRVMSSRTSTRIAVLKGGFSAERDVSLVSGRECAAALRSEGFDVVEIDAGEDLFSQLEAAAPDVAVNALHGRWGEDGCVQGILEWLRIPYTHSGVMASALAMDKVRTKEIYAAHDLPIVAHELVEANQVRKAHPMKPPYVVKPYNEGSSVEVYIVPEGANSPPQLSENMPKVVMAEAFVPGRELTVTVMGDRSLSVTDILTNGWYDYQAKYADGGSRHIVPCRGVSRTDLRWDDGKGINGLFLLETNTQPGMTPTSLAPEQAAHCGIPFGQLVSWMVEDASCFR